MLFLEVYVCLCCVYTNLHMFNISTHTHTHIYIYIPPFFKIFLLIILSYKEEEPKECHYFKYSPKGVVTLLDKKTNNNNNHNNNNNNNNKLIIIIIIIIIINMSKRQTITITIRTDHFREQRSK